MQAEHFVHKTVLKEETVTNLLPCVDLLTKLKAEGQDCFYFVDCTLGGAGHSLHFIEKFFQQKYPLKLHVYGFDLDSVAIEIARHRFSDIQKIYPGFSFELIHANFSYCSEFFQREASEITPHALCADFGVSSYQLDTPDRGFSFHSPSPLDMRMNQEDPLTAVKILMTYSEKELTDIFFKFGEEPRARRAAKAIVSDREAGRLKVDSSQDFAQYLGRILGYGHSRTHPATKIFQALRIAVNGELDSIQNLLATVPKFMHPDSRVGFITFHSLEDRIVKRCLKNWARGKSESDEFVECHSSKIPKHIQVMMTKENVKEMGYEFPKGGQTPSEEEVKLNPRARSARLRCFQFKE